MADQSSPLNDGDKQTRSNLDSILAQLDTLGSSAADLPGVDSPGLSSVPDLPIEAPASAVVADAAAVAAALSGKPVDAPAPKLTLVAEHGVATPVQPEPEAEPVVEGFLTEYRPKNATAEPVVARTNSPNHEGIASVFGSSTLPAAAQPAAASRQFSPFNERPAAAPPAARFTPPDTVISRPEVSPSEKVDYFADLEGAEPVVIAGVDPNLMVNHQNVDVASPETVDAPAVEAPSANADVFPFNLYESPPLDDRAGLLQDPLAIRDATPETLDAEYFEEANGHGVSFPAVAPGVPAAIDTGTVPISAVPDSAPAPAQAGPVESIENDAGGLPVRLLIISTILLALIAFAAIMLNNPDVVDSIRDAFSNLFG